MSWPSNAARTKTWGTEVLTSSDLQGQFDLLCQYFIDSLNGTTGHKHTGGTNDGQQIILTTGVTGVLPVANGGTNASSASITAFNNITGFSAAGTTGTNSTNLVFSTSPTLVTPNLGTPTTLTLTNATGLPAAGLTGVLGTWATKSTGSPIQATTDGFVICVVNTGASNNSYGNLFTDSSNPPTTRRSRVGSDSSVSGPNGVVGTLFSPVKKNDYYEVTLTGAATAPDGMFFIPLGS